LYLSWKKTLSQKQNQPVTPIIHKDDEIMFRFLIALIFSACAVSGFAPLTGTFHRTDIQVRSVTPSNLSVPPSRVESATVLFERRDASRSGTKRERLDRLAELEENRIETDKSVVLKGAGAFVGLIFLLLIVAGATGVLDPIMNGGY